MDSPTHTVERPRISKLGKVFYHKSRPLDPKYLPRTDCPYIITPAAQRIYPLKEIWKIVNQLNVCAHGWFCEKCCHEYTGEFAREQFRTDELRQVFIYYSGGGSSIREDLPLFITTCFFGAYLLDNTFIIVQDCGNKRCVNPFHWSYQQRVFNKQAMKITIHEFVYFYSQVCIHGHDCTECCWSWLGPHSRELVPIIRGKQSMKAPVSTVIIESRDGVRITKDLSVVWSCQNKQCVNPHHISYGPYKAGQKFLESSKRARLARLAGLRSVA